MKLLTIILFTICFICIIIFGISFFKKQMNPDVSIKDMGIITISLLGIALTSLVGLIQESKAKKKLIAN